MALISREDTDNLVQLLSKKPGTKEEKAEWLYQNIDLMVAELEKAGVENPSRNWGALRVMIFRWYTNYLNNPRRDQPMESFEERKARHIREFGEGKPTVQ